MVLGLLAFILGVQGTLGFLKLPNKFYEEFVTADGGYSFDRVLMSGRGLMTSVHVRYNDGGSAEWTDFVVFHRVYENNAIQYTQTASCSPLDFVSGDNFGGDGSLNPWGNTALIHTPVAGNVFMMSSYAADVPAIVDGVQYTRANGGAVYLWTGVWSKWSQHQKITLGNDARDEDWFGMSVGMNRKYIGEAAIGCGRCDPLTAWQRDGTGAIYTYTAKPPMFNAWTQQQQLFEYDYSLNYTGVVVDLHANTLAALASRGMYYAISPANAVQMAVDTIAAYSRPNKDASWSFSQYLDASTWGPEDSYMRVWEDAIFIGDKGFKRDPQITKKFGGRLLIYYPDTPAYKTKPGARKLEESPAEMQYVTGNEWKGNHWSLSQTLLMPSPQYVFQQSFGGYFDVFEDTMVVLAQRNRKPPATAYKGYVFVYEREYMGGQWSHQQAFQPLDSRSTFTAPTMFHNVLSHSFLSEVGGISSTQMYYSTDTVWDCLIVVMEDQFGDGWDTAQLRVDAPDGTYDLYSPSCDSTNGLKFRYCPWHHKDIGLYKFRIVDAEKAKYNWEIQWRVFEEKTGQWFMGRHNTAMDFHWDGKDFDFTHRAIIHDLPLNITCNECRPRPTHTPTMSPTTSKKHRELKGKTFSPTVSPAPTLSQVDVIEWRWFILKTSTLGKSWFDEEHKGTNYYISDAQGHRLISTGTMCPWEGASKECWQELPDGDYTLRVSGDLNVDNGLHTWEFCGRTGSANEMMTFRVTEGACDALLGYTRTTYCSKKLHTTAVASYDIELFGLTTADLKAGANSGIMHAVSTVFPEVSENDVTVSSVVDNGQDGVLMHVQVKIEVASLGFDPDDVESVPEAFVVFSQAMKTAVRNGAFLAALQSGEANYGFGKLTGATVVSDQMLFGGVPDISNLEASQEYTKDYYKSDESPVYKDKRAEDSSWNTQMIVFVTEKYSAYAAAAVGYVMFAGFVAALAVYTLRNPRASIRSVKEAGEGVGEALVSAVADEEDMVLDKSGMKKVLPSVSNVPSLAAKKLKAKIVGGADRVGYSLVSSLDDIADGVVDFVLPPADSSSGSEDGVSGGEDNDEEEGNF